jgi:hypothetical protein
MMTGGEERWGGGAFAGGYRSLVKILKRKIEVEAPTGDGGRGLYRRWGLYRRGEACTGGGEDRCPSTGEERPVQEVV